MKREIELDIAGQRIRVRTDEDESYMRSLAAYVDERMHEVSRGQRGVASLTVALLAALRIADDYQKCQRTVAATDEALERLASVVEAALETDDR